MLRILKILVVLVAAYWTAAWFLQRRMIFPGHWANRHTSRIHTEVEGVEKLWLETEAGRTEYWFHPAPAASPGDPAPLLVFTHGNGELIDGQAALVRGFQELGFHVALCEYRGYGRSDGAPSQASATTDALAMLDELLARPAVDAERVVYYGRSLGGGIACSMAVVRPPSALVLQSTFESMARMLQGYLIPPFLVRDPFDNAGAVAAFDGPVLVLHGTRDRIIDYDHSAALLAASERVERVTYDCGHNDFPVADESHCGPVRTFLLQADVLPAGGRGSGDR
ncbi:MAG: alpha/beta fold hydrolase [Planctomycetota bacterium]|nr:alpha/beta fold hydrolase [Planctomycetota bacterium]